VSLSCFCVCTLFSFAFALRILKPFVVVLCLFFITRLFFDLFFKKDEEPFFVRNAHISTEIRVCSTVAEIYPKNYYAWTHRQWLVQLFTFDELKSGFSLSKEWLIARGRGFSFFLFFSFYSHFFFFFRVVFAHCFSFFSFFSSFIFSRFVKGRPGLMCLCVCLCMCV